MIKTILIEIFRTYCSYLAGQVPPSWVVMVVPYSGTLVIPYLSQEDRGFREYEHLERRALVPGFVPMIDISDYC